MPRRARIDEHVNQRCCATCKEWKPHSHFCKRRRIRPEGTFWDFDADCRACQQIARNEKKNQDRSHSIIERRARQLAARCGVAFDFFWTNLGWKSLAVPYRALATNLDTAICQSCRHPFEHERDIQIEHISPPRHDQDWARHDARNIRFLCTNCNRAKSSKDHPTWLDEEEGARISNERHESSVQESAWDAGLRAWNRAWGLG